MSDRGPSLLLVLGTLGLVLSLTVVSGLVGSGGWRWVENYRARMGSPVSRDRARLLAALPAGSVAVLLVGSFLAVSDPVGATPLAVGGIASLVVAILMGVYPDPFLPRWVREGQRAPAGSGAQGPGPGTDERVATLVGRGVVLALGVACVPLGLGLTQVPGMSALGVAIAALGALGVVVALRRQRT